MVRERALGGSFEEQSGNLSLGGIYFTGHPPAGRRRRSRSASCVPGDDEEIEAAGEVIRVRRDRRPLRLPHPLHRDPVEGELAVARYLQAVTAGP